jgi:hypothetical protein
MRRTFAAAIGLALLAIACARREARSPEARFSISAEKAELQEQESRDRREFVSEAPPSWKPERPGRVIGLTLTVEKSTLRPGDALRYRLDVQNVGKKDVAFDERPSFLKFDNSRERSFYDLILTTPDGKSSSLLPPFPDFDSYEGAPTLDASSMTAAQKAAAISEYDARQRADGFLFLTLHPGETMSTRPDGPDSNGYRVLHTAYRFEKPGAYGLRAVYDSRSLPDGLRAESNAVTFQVAR